MILPDELYDFAYFYDALSALQTLASMAISEPWRFLHPLFPTFNKETPILEKYIRNVFRRVSVNYTCEDDPVKKDQILYMHNNMACFHTGLLTPFYEGIYALFERNKLLNTRFDWVFKGFFPESSMRLKMIVPLPSKPSCFKETDAFHPEWPIRINYSHILDHDANMQRIPEAVRHANNLPILLHAAVLYVRAMAQMDYSIIVPQMYGGHIQYLMPIYLTDIKKCDLAMALSSYDGFYLGHTCLTTEMAYHNARVISRPVTPWLANLVSDHNRDYPEQNSLRQLGCLEAL